MADHCGEYLNKACVRGLWSVNKTNSLPSRRKQKFAESGVSCKKLPFQGKLSGKLLRVEPLWCEKNQRHPQRGKLWLKYLGSQGLEDQREQTWRGRKPGSFLKSRRELQPSLSMLLSVEQESLQQPWWISCRSWGYQEAGRGKAEMMSEWGRHPLLDTLLPRYSTSGLANSHVAGLRGHRGGVGQEIGRHDGGVTLSQDCLWSHNQHTQNSGKWHQESGPSSAEKYNQHSSDLLASWSTWRDQME